VNALVKQSPENVAETNALVDELGRDLKNEAGRYTLKRHLSNEERVKLQARQLMLFSNLRSITYSAADKKPSQMAGAAVAEMFQGFINWKPDPNVKEQSIGWYVSELRDLPLFAIEAACKDVREGRVEGLKPDYPPSSARLVSLARSHADRAMRDHAMVKLLLSVKHIRDEKVIDEKVAKRVGELLKDHAAKMAEGLVREDAEVSAARSKKAIEKTDQEIRREYEAQGLKPIRGFTGKPASLSLAKKIAEWQSEAKPAPRDPNQDQGS
jgi:hypothetical protein